MKTASTVHQKTTADFVYSGQIVPIATRLGQNDRIWLLKIYLHDPVGLAPDIEALQDAVEKGDNEALRVILRRHRPQDEPFDPTQGKPEDASEV